MGKHYWKKAARRWRVNALIKKYGGKCAFCNVGVVFTPNDPAQASVDHIMPLSKGGGQDFTNLQLLCSKCNEDKGDSIIDEDGEIVDVYRKKCAAMCSNCHRKLHAGKLKLKK